MKKTLFVAVLLALPMVSGAFLFGMGTEDESMEIICVKEKLTNPLTLNPTAGFATHRFPSISSTYIIKVRRVVAEAIIARSIKY